jgi:hypothetical protein
MRRSVAAGWGAFDPLHVELLDYEAARGALGDGAVDGPAGPVVEWPVEWGAWSLASHRRELADHWRDLARIRAEEARNSGG